MIRMRATIQPTVTPAIIPALVAAQKEQVKLMKDRINKYITIQKFGVNTI